MELQSLQSQLKSAIQNHQIVLSKMRIDPQNSALQRQLHDLQAEIMTLSDKQKQVVQQLRSELERKQSSAVLKLSHNAQLLPRGMLGGAGVPVKLQAALKGGPGGVLLPQVVVVPSCSGPPHGPPTLMAPSIRVPQYPPCGQRLAPQQPLVQTQHQQPQQQHQQSQHQHTLVATAPSVPRVPKSCVAVLVQASSINSTAAGLVVPNLGTSIHSNTNRTTVTTTTTTTTTNGICATGGATTMVTVTAAMPAPVPTAAVAPPRRTVPVAPPPPSAPPPTKEDHQHEMPTRAELVGCGWPEMCFVIFAAAASASLRLRSSNSAWVSSFLEQGVVARSFDVFNQSKPLRNEVLTYVELVGPEQLERQVVVFLLLSVLRQQRESETKSGCWVTPKYNSYDASGAKRDVCFTPPAADNGGAFGLSHNKSVQYASNGTMPHGL
ncbi:uncharacterized protein LOC142578804 isoform X2 [Dermacentor variabilis]|uniref:uncharacterized protein LOC142578804 isoform X2 n=1 Tax=Dermacentor variabilis TaxID=34621 RepID=UPI003F5B18EA